MNRDLRDKIGMLTTNIDLVMIKCNDIQRVRNQEPENPQLKQKRDELEKKQKTIIKQHR
jgi:hypothetical protein